VFPQAHSRNDVIISQKINLPEESRRSINTPAFGPKAGKIDLQNADNLAGGGRRPDVPGTIRQRGSWWGERSKFGQQRTHTSFHQTRYSCSVLEI
jgi:hypothetical protein